jgi:hypothetical protein
MKSALWIQCGSGVGSRVHGPFEMVEELLAYRVVDEKLEFATFG